MVRGMRKFIKGISFFAAVLLLLGAGFFMGVQSMLFFYPGHVGKQAIEEEQSVGEGISIENEMSMEEKMSMEERMSMEDGLARDWQKYAETSLEQEASLLAEAASARQTLCADTEYVLEETDIVNHTVVETVKKLPLKYVGMDREQFLVAMESYEAYPPLSEQERGFVGLEVLSFSRERVVIQMNYEYLQPGRGFYLAVRDNEVVVYQEDCETVYINTGIMLDTLPEDTQLKIIQMIWIEGEEELYDFLENYSS